MKFNKIMSVALVAGAVVLGAIQAQAQLGFDLYSAVRTVDFSSAQVWLTVTNSSGGALGAAATNGPVDLSIFVGTAKVDLELNTNQNGAGGTITAQIQTSADKTNWVNLSNYSLGIPTTITYTNQIYGNASNLTCNTTYNLPGTPTTPVGYLAGFATPYLTPALFTNTAAITVSPGQVTTIGFRRQDTGRYVQVIWVPGGTATNCSVSATLTGQTSQPY